MAGLGTLAFGAALGALLVVAYDLNTPHTPSPMLQSTTPNATTESSSIDSGAFLASSRIELLTNQLNASIEQAYELESRVMELSARVAELENTLAISPPDHESGAEETTANPAIESTSSKPVSDNLRISTLVEAGIDEQLAADILRRRGEMEMKRLELRDQAIRDGSFGSKRYSQALQKLHPNATALRQEIGDEAYDRYLYATKQSNRIVVTSVIQGSPAEQADIRQGDVILSYDNARLFSWSELTKATTQGELGEYVAASVQRDGVIINLWLPRGPLGVRLGSTRGDPNR
ncbi:MAG: PDZ domain-containing protein, partial [Pseudomonadota bacterium]